MPKKKKRPGKAAPRKPARARPRKAAAQVATSSLELHDLFQRQAAQILDNADISEEDKQNILVAISCPCCGSSAMSFTVKLKPRPRFVADDGA